MNKMKGNEALGEDEVLINNDINPEELAIGPLPEVARRTVIEEYNNEVIFYFHPSVYRLEEGEAEVLKTINSLSWMGRITGYDLERFQKGEVRIYFNPLCQTSDSREEAIAEMLNSIRRMPKR